MEKLARSYIEKRTQQTRTEDSDKLAERLGWSWDHNIYSHLGHAREAAWRGLPSVTASFLNHQDNTEVLVSAKGEILAKAYAKYAERRGRAKVYYHLPGFQDLQERRQKEAQQSKRIAQGLTRAAQRSQKA